MSDTLIDQALTLMLVGMGTVFVFLTLLVMGMSLMAFVVARATPNSIAGASEEEVAAITAAIALHKTNNP